MRPDCDLNLRNVAAACAAITVFGLAFGMSYPLLSLVLESRGYNADLIGLNAAMVPLGIVVVSPWIPQLARRFGAKRCNIVAAIVIALCLLLYRAVDSLALWFVLRLLQGMASATLYVLSEVWIVRYAGSRLRGRVVSVYASLLSASFAVGPFLISVLGFEGWLPFVVGTGVVLVGMLPLFFVREVSALTTPADSASLSVRSFVPLAPVLLTTVAIFAVMDASSMALLPIYALEHGLNFETATLLLSVFVAGNAVLQYPIGMLADRFEARAVTAGCAAVCGLAFLLLPSVIGTVWQWPVMVLGGATGFGVYTVSLKSLGDRFTGEQLVAGSSAVGVVWGGGALVGAVIGGVAMTAFGANGFPFLLAGSFALLTGLLVWRKTH